MSYYYVFSVQDLPTKSLPSPSPVEKVKTAATSSSAPTAAPSAVISNSRSKTNQKSAIFDDDSDDQDDLFSAKPKVAQPAKPAVQTSSPSVSKVEAKPPAPAVAKPEPPKPTKATIKPAPTSIFDDEEEEDDLFSTTKKPPAVSVVKSISSKNDEEKQQPAPRAPVEVSKTSQHAPEKWKLPGLSTEVAPPPVKTEPIQREKEAESETPKITAVMSESAIQNPALFEPDEDVDGDDLFSKKPPELKQSVQQTEPVATSAVKSFTSDVVNAVGK